MENPRINELYLNILPREMLFGIRTLNQRVMENEIMYNRYGLEIGFIFFKIGFTSSIPTE